MSLDAVYVSYWSLRDPLCLSQSLPVLRALSQSGRRLALITFEQRQWALSPDAEAQMRQRLASEGIRWRPLHYHKRPRVLSTALDIALGVWECIGLASKERVGLFHGRGTVAAAIAFVASRLTGARFLNDADGPLSQEYVDAGILKSGSFPHRVTRYAEGRFLRAADAVAVLTERRRLQVQASARGVVTVIPCGVDTQHFVPRDSTSKRQELGLEGLVFVYAGKAGGWYLTDAMLDFVKVAGDVLGKTSLLVLTTQDHRRFSDAAAARGLACVVRSASREEMPHYLSAGDVGLSFVLPSPSKTACSPVKNGEYLSCGLPIVTTSDIGDYSDLVLRRRVGVVVKRLDGTGYREAAGELGGLLADFSLYSRCRAVAKSEVGLMEVVVPRYMPLYEQLVSLPRTRDVLDSDGTGRFRPRVDSPKRDE